MWPGTLPGGRHLSATGNRLREAMIDYQVPPSGTSRDISASFAYLSQHPKARSLRATLCAPDLEAEASTADEDALNWTTSPASHGRPWAIPVDAIERRLADARRYREHALSTGYEPRGTWTITCDDAPLLESFRSLAADAAVHELGLSGQPGSVCVNEWLHTTCATVTADGRSSRVDGRPSDGHVVMSELADLSRLALDGIRRHRVAGTPHLACQDAHASRSWASIRFGVLSDQQLQVHCESKYLGAFNFAELGFSDRRKTSQPIRAWLVLLQLAREKEVQRPSIKEPRLLAKVEKDIQTVRRKLREFMRDRTPGLEGDPIQIQSRAGEGPHVRVYVPEFRSVVLGPAD